MHKLLAFALIGVCSAARAQTPSVNFMPDGSHDMYVGLGAAATPRWEGAREHRTRAWPLLQVEWSNGVFVSGMGAGWHLSQEPGIEAGPLLAIQPGRSDAGSRATVGGVTGSSTTSTLVQPNTATVPAGANRLYGMRDVPTRLQAGGFFNAYLSPQLRVTNSLLYGAGQDHNGLAWNLDLQRLAIEIAPHHTLSASVGTTVVNGAWNRSYFGVSFAEALHSRNAMYTPGGGIKDLHAGLRWNWAFSPAWMMTSTLSVTRLQGDAADSPLTERSTNTSIAAGLAYRF